MIVAQLTQTSCFVANYQYLPTKTRLVDGHRTTNAVALISYVTLALGTRSLLMGSLKLKFYSITRLQSCSCLESRHSSHVMHRADFPLGSPLSSKPQLLPCPKLSIDKSHERYYTPGFFLTVYYVTEYSPTVILVLHTFDLSMWWPLYCDLDLASWRRGHQ